MDQITSSPRSVEDSSSWKHSHQRLSLMLTEKLDRGALNQTSQNRRVPRDVNCLHALRR